MEQLVILVIIGLISLVNWVLQRAAKRREELQQNRPAHAEDHRSAELRPQTSTRPAKDPMRELMEALGLPLDEAPPPLPQRAAPVVVKTEEEFASMEGSEPAAAPPLRSWKQPAKPDEKTVRLAGAFAAAEHATPSPRLHGVRSLLSGRARQREAIILAEILGPPRALRPASFVP